MRPASSSSRLPLFAATRNSIPEIQDLEIREKVVEVFKTQIRNKIEMSAIHARTTPIQWRTKLDKWEAHFYSRLAKCAWQILLAAETLGVSPMYVSDVASPYFSVKLKSGLGIPEPLEIYRPLPVGFAKRSPTIHHPRQPPEDELFLAAVRAAE